MVVSISKRVVPDYADEYWWIVFFIGDKVENEMKSCDACKTGDLHQIDTSDVSDCFKHNLYNL